MRGLSLPNKLLYFFAGRVVQFQSLGEDYVRSPAKELRGGAIWPDVPEPVYVVVAWKLMRVRFQYKTITYSKLYT